MDFQHREKISSNEIKAKEIEIVYLQNQLKGSLPRLNVDIQSKSKDSLNVDVEEEKMFPSSSRKNKIASSIKQDKNHYMININSSSTNPVSNRYNNTSAKKIYPIPNKVRQISYVLNTSMDNNNNNRENSISKIKFVKPTPKFYLTKETIAKGYFSLMES